MSDFKYADDKLASIWVRGSIRVVRAKDGTFTITAHLLDELDEYGEDFCGREVYTSSPEAHPTADAIWRMVREMVEAKYGSTSFELAKGYTHPTWEEPLTEADRKAKELADMAAELRAMMAD